MFDEVTKQLEKIEDLNDYDIRVEFDPYSLPSIEAAISRTIMDLERWAKCGQKDDLLRATLDQFAEGIREHVVEKAREMRTNGEDMRSYPQGDLGKQLRALSKHVEALSYVEYDEAQDRAVRIAKVLQSDPLSSYVAGLTKDLDLNAFLTRTHQSGGSMIGSSSYQWPEGDDDKLGMSLALALHFGDMPDDLIEHGCDIFGETNFNKGVQKVYSNVYVPMEQDLRDHISASLGERSTFTFPHTVEQSNRIFVVHGHNEGMREGTARFIENLGLEPVILHEQQNRGATVIEKLEANSDVGFAVILMSSDDVGRSKTQEDLENRPRQNVVLEAGWFMGRFGRERTIVLKDPQLSLPSDLQGLVYTDRDPAGAWKQELVRELNGAGYDVRMP